MEHRERIHRPDPERTAPYRDSAAHVFNATLGGGPKSKPDANKQDGAASDVAYGVMLGYQVIEKQIREGQRLAQRLREAADLKGVTGSEEISPLFWRVLHAYKDLGSVCFEAAEALLSNTELRSALSRLFQGKPESVAEPDARTDAGCALMITSSRPTKVTLTLGPRLRTSLPRVHALHAQDAAIPPLTNVRFTADPATRVPILQVDIANTQPPATYTGVIVDGVTNEPCGTLSIRVMP
jgi:hypothetical protein